jgi:DNA-binding response OmpR family regulator
VSGPLVYIVDDEAVVGDLIGQCLKRRGYRTRVFRSPMVAYSAFTFGPEKPDLLITDHAMAGITGLELVRYCKQACGGLKTMCVSGLLTDDILCAGEVKPDVMLQKPFASEALVTHVEALIGQAAARRPATHP